MSSPAVCVSEPASECYRAYRVHIAMAYSEDLLMVLKVVVVADIKREVRVALAFLKVEVEGPRACEAFEGTRP